MNNSYLEVTHSLQTASGFKAANRHTTTNNVRVNFIIFMIRLGLKKEYDIKEDMVTRKKIKEFSRTSYKLWLKNVLCLRKW